MEEKRKKVFDLLSKFHLKLVWLESELLRAGYRIKQSELSEILHGRRNTVKAKLIIEASLNLLEKYEKTYFSA